MKWQQLLIELYGRLSGVLDKALDGLTLADLKWQPDPESNSMGWLTWHLTRSQDRTFAEISGEEQLWIKDRWHTKFNRPPEPTETGFKHTAEDVAGLEIPDAKTLLDYNHAVLEKAKRCLDTLSEADLDRKVDNPTYPTIHARIVGNLNDNLQHAGQVAYLRGLLKGKGWLGL